MTIEAGSRTARIQQVFAEFVGTAVFVTISTGAAVGAIGTLGTAMAFGFTITAVAYAIGHVSGGQLNPAVTLGLVASANLPAIQGALVMGGQMAGAIVGSCLVYSMHPGSDLGANILPDDVQPGRAFLAEAFGTFALVFVVLQTAYSSGHRVLAPLAIGYTVFVAHLLLIPYTSASINPARSLGPAIISGTWSTHFWVFIVGPFSGALAAAPVHILITRLDDGGQHAPHKTPALVTSL